MERQITLCDLARRVGVHPMTVSRALRDSPKISVAVRRRIQVLARRLHYTPNHLARSLRQRSSRALGVVFPYATTPYYATLLDALYAKALDRGYQIEIRFHRWNEAEETAALRNLLERQVDGLILLPAGASSFQTLRNMLPKHANCRISTTGAYRPGEFPPFVRGSVVTDMRRGSAELGEFLLEMGHRRIAMLYPGSRPKTGFRDVTDHVHWLRKAIERQPGAQLQVIELEDSPSLLPGAEREFECGRRLAGRFLQLTPRPTAAVSNNEVQAQVLLEILGAHGCRVPDDVSVACFDGTFLSEHGTVPLTCMKRSLPDIAHHLVDLATGNSMNDNGRQPELRVVQATLARRRSVGPPRNGST